MSQPPPDYSQPPPGYGQPPPPGSGYQFPSETPAKKGGFNACCCRKYAPPKAGCATAVTDIVFSVFGIIAWLSILFGLGVSDVYDQHQKASQQYDASLKNLEAQGVSKAELVKIPAYVNTIAPVYTMSILTLVADLILIILSALVIVTLKKSNIFGTWIPVAWSGTAFLRIIYWIIFLCYWCEEGTSTRLKTSVSGSAEIALYLNEKLENSTRGGRRGGPTGRAAGEGSDDEPVPPPVLEPLVRLIRDVLKYLLLSILSIFMLIYIWLIVIMVGYAWFKIVNRDRAPPTTAEDFNPEPIENTEGMPDEATPSTTAGA